MCSTIIEKNTILLKDIKEICIERYITFMNSKPQYYINFKIPIDSFVKLSKLILNFILKRPENNQNSPKKRITD